MSEEEEEEEGEQQDEGHRDPNQDVQGPLETLGRSDVMNELRCHLMSTYCVRGTCWGLSFICSNLTALVHQGWLTHHPVHCGSERSAMCPTSPSLAGAGLRLDPRMWAPLCDCYYYYYFFVFVYAVPGSSR